MSLVDGNERELATDPAQSFIVQAPAGSGKTEVLTQRYLRLLSKVNKPEEIISITFTKKAANEMRERILRALQKANNNEIPCTQHQLTTYKFAQQALQHAKKLNWDILEQPHSLRVITIDSLCQMLANAIYIQDSKTAFAEICTNPQEIYQNTARNCLNYAATNDNYREHLQILLTHLDNRQDNTLKLLTDLLASRDTWLTQLFTAKAQNQTEFARGIKLIEEKALQNFCNTINNEQSFRLLNIIKSLYSILNLEGKELYSTNNICELNSKSANELCNLLLTSNNKLRKSFDQHVGLKKGICNDIDYQDLKAKSKDILAELASLPNFLDALLQIKDLPNPKYSQQQWQVLQSLFAILPLLVAYLEINFQENNQVDFSAIANEALQALGDDLEPTNLTLYLDNKIQHILIDEFQDTSLKQFQLISKLVQGWQEGDGRSLFVVGDPQQSIYRFRGAEVGLFLKAKKFGIANVSLTSLNLTCNFRSSTNIVNWVNQNFKNIFPQLNDINSGAITYSNSIATQSTSELSFIQAHEFKNPDEEAKFIVKTVIQEQQLNPDVSIAILVRSRKQLSAIMHEVREQNIPYQGVDIDLLAKQEHIRDVYSLTQTLLMPGNRLASLTFLRSTFCGLDLKDILAIAEYAPQKSIFFALSNLEKITGLSKSGYTRANYIFNVLNKATQTRSQNNTVDWLTDTLQELHVENVLDTQQLLDLEQYWQLLDEYLVAGDIADWKLFKEQLNKLYSKQTTYANLQIMTIHKSKGLEFDCVIAPGLGSKSINQDSTLFKTLNLPDEKNQDILLFSPIKAASADSCNLYNYIKKIDEQKSNYELQRLLYVAVTRAKQRLYLTDCHTSSNKNCFKSFLKEVNFLKSDDSQEDVQNESALPILKRLPDELYAQFPNRKVDSTGKSQFTISEDSARIQGVVTHEVLQWICENHPPTASDVPKNFIQNLLREQGIYGNDLQEILHKIQNQIHNLFQDPTGRWIITHHQAAKNELELLINEKGSYKTKIIDRTFVEDNNLWIIDFKTGKDDVTSEKKYIQQVNEYAEIMNDTKQTIKCGLYYLSNNHWQSWTFKNPKSSKKYSVEIEV